MKSIIQLFIVHLAISSAILISAARPALAGDVRICVLDKYAPQKVRLLLLDRQGNPSGPLISLELNAASDGLILSSGLRRPAPIARTVFNGEGGIRVTVIDGKDSERPVRTYPGRLAVSVYNGAIELINIVDHERYLAGVIAAEMAGAPQQAQAALAVAARTILAYRLSNSSHPNRDCDLCDLTHCQAYSGLDGVTESITRAIEESADYLLTYEGRPIDALYHSTCGGVTVEPTGLWDHAPALSHLVAVDDTDPKTGRAHCADSPHFEWEWIISHSEFLDFIDRNYNLRQIPQWIGNDGGRIITAVIGVKKIPIELFRSAIGKQFGWNKLKSNFFTATIENDRIVFRGRGLGHGAGLCQYGAIGMARQGKNWREILRHYYPHAQLQRLDRSPN